LGYLSTKYSHTVDKEFLLMHGHHNLYFKLHVYDQIHFHRMLLHAADCAPLHEPYDQGQSLLKNFVGDKPLRCDDMFTQP